MNGLTFLDLGLLLGKQVFVVRGLVLVFAKEFLYFVLVQVLHDEDCILLFLGLLEFLLEDFHLVRKDVVLFDGQFPLILKVLVALVV